MASIVQDLFLSVGQELTDPTDAPQNISRGVRQETAELASRALSEAGSTSIYQGSSPSSESTALDQSLFSTLRKDGTERAHAGVVPEILEPISPQNHMGARRSLGKSVLAEMIQSDMSNDGEAAINGSPGLAENEDDGFNSVMVNPAIISQPGEQTPLLHKKSATFLAQRRLPRFFPSSLSNLLYRGLGEVKGGVGRCKAKLDWMVSPKGWNKRNMWARGVVKPASYLPAVALGLLLNVLVSSKTTTMLPSLTLSKDALSYGKHLQPI